MPGFCANTRREQAEAASRNLNPASQAGQPDVAELHGTALALKRDIPAADRSGALVLQNAVDTDRDMIAHADDLGTVPFACGPLALPAAARLDEDPSVALRPGDLRAAQLPYQSS